jgi:hypothetical protein
LGQKRGEPSAISIYRSGTIEKSVPGSDPTYDEILTASLAGRYGITTSEYRKREQEAQSCHNNPQHVSRIPECEDATMWGLSVSVYRERWAKVQRDCFLSPKQAFSDEESAIFEENTAQATG